MALKDRLMDTTGQLLRESDPDASPARPLAWLKKLGSYSLLNRFIGRSIPFASRNGFLVEEVGPGYVRAKIRLKGNRNHFGGLYAGAFFLVAEIPGGVLSMLELGPAYTPILKDMSLTFLKPAKSDVTVEFYLDETTLAAIRHDADSSGRAAFSLEGTLCDDSGEVVATSVANYRVRKKGADW